MSKKCRICFCSDERLSSLALHKIVAVDENGSSKEINLVDIYEEVTQVKYERTDWEWICDGCQDKLIGYYKFRQLCRKSAQEINERQNDGKTEADFNFEEDNNSIEEYNEPLKIDYDSEDTESSNDQSDETMVKSKSAFDCSWHFQ